MSHWKDVSDEARDMIKRLLTLNPDNRITTSDALVHPWMKDDNIINEASKLMGDEASKVAMLPPPRIPVSHVTSFSY